MTKLRPTEWKQIAQSNYLAEFTLKARISHFRCFHHTALPLSLALSLNETFLYFSILSAQLQPLYTKAHRFLFLCKHKTSVINRGHRSQFVTSYTDLPLPNTDDLFILTWFGTTLNITCSPPRSQLLDTDIESLHHSRVVLMELFPCSFISKFCFSSLIHWHNSVFTCIWIL